jgi:VIT1/CCC1 family predicted Fe2+/Mn2+ transporter
MVFSAISYINSPDMIKTFQHFGFPDFFRVELAVAKIIGVVILIVPAFSVRLKEWAYSGFTIVFISAAIAHLSSGDGVGVAIFPMIILAILLVSYIYYHKLKLVIA